MHTRASVLLATILPAVAAGAAYELLLGHRHDYTGHFLAGYGGTLGALMVWLRIVPASRYGVFGFRSIVPICLVCIALGAVFESTIFRLAKFDEVDFCNQSLGAVIAAGAALHFTGTEKPAVWMMHSGLIVGVIVLAAGGIYAFA